MEKYYEVKVDDLSYGRLDKKTDSYQKAKSFYNNMNLKLSKVPCKVSLKKIEVHPQTGEVVENIQYLNTPGQSVTLENKLLQLKTIIDEIYELQTEFKTIEADDNDLFFNVRHALEIGIGNTLTPEESKNVLDNIQLEGIVRRGAKKELKKHNYCRQSLSNIQLNINKAIADLERFNKDQIKCNKSENKIKADEKYEKVLKELAVMSY